MENHSDTLDRAFHALSDPTRRAILRQLSLGEASVSALAEPHALRLPTLLKHLGVLEAAGLVATKKVGRVRWVSPQAARLEAAQAWLIALHASWDGRLDRLDRYLQSKPKGESDAT